MDIQHKQEKTKEKNAVSSPINQLDKDEARWFAVHTKFKCEKYVVALLERKSIHAYLPMRTNVRVYGGRKRSSEIPVISCYTFVKITEPEYIKVLETEHVLAFVRSAKNLIAIPEQEMLNLRRVAMDENLDWTISPELMMHEGKEVIVTAGSLAGMKGKVVKIEGKEKFLIELETLGHSILVTMDAKYFS